jgi:hypothetical protein
MSSCHTCQFLRIGCCGPAAGAANVSELKWGDMHMNRTPRRARAIAIAIAETQSAARIATLRVAVLAATAACLAYLAARAL